MKAIKIKELIVIPVMLVVWEILSHLFDKPFFPGFLKSIASLFEIMKTGIIWEHMAASTYRIILGTLLGLLFSVPVGILLGTKKSIDDVLGQLFNILYPVPKVVFLPVIVVIMGIGDFPKIFLIALVLFFQLTIVIRDSAKSLPDNLYDSMKSFDANGLQFLCNLVIPGCMPDIMTSVRSSIGISTAMLFITENFAASKGLGYYITKCMDSRDYNNMYAGVIMLGLLGVVLYGMIGLLENSLCRWKTLETKHIAEN